MRHRIAAMLLLSAAALAGCGGGGGGGATAPANAYPPAVVVTKTPDAAQYAPYAPVTLDASGSTDPESPGAGLRYTWTLNGEFLSDAPTVTIVENGAVIDNLSVQVCDDGAPAPRCASRAFPVVYARCAACHGPDGTVPGAPVVSAYWTTGGHGRQDVANARGGVPVTCEDCHDIGYLAAADHKGTVGGAAPLNINTLQWPGKSVNADTRPNRNTAHLRAEFISASPDRAEVARTFDNRCLGPAAGCHPAAFGHRHQIPGDPALDRDVMRFGIHGTNPAPKEAAWFDLSGYLADYGAPSPAGRFHASPAVWIDNDISAFPTDNATAYGLCITCHDPHGTGTTDTSQGARGTTNHMLRANWRSDYPGYCTSPPCHSM